MSFFLPYSGHGCTEVNLVLIIKFLQITWKDYQSPKDICELTAHHELKLPPLTVCMCVYVSVYSCVGGDCSLISWSLQSD